MKTRTPYLKLLSASTMALLVVMVAGFLTSERASAQRIPPPAPADPVLAAVQDVQRSIVGLQANLEALQSGLDLQLEPMAVKSRWTPAVRVFYDNLTCKVVNISDVEKTIHIEVKGQDGETQKEETFNVAPGATRLVVISRRDFGFYCKFTVINGTRADIRGTLLGFGSSNPGHTFQIPAE